MPEEGEERVVPHRIAWVALMAAMLTAAAPAGSAVAQGTLPAPPEGPLESRMLVAPERPYAAANPALRRVVFPSPAATGSALASVFFPARSADFSPQARHDLEQVVKTMPRRARLTLDAVASAPDPDDARKIALARALAVQSYLVDLGVPRGRIEIGGFRAAAGDGPTDQVDVGVAE